MPTPETKPPISPAVGEFGLRVRDRRKSMNMSQEGLAEHSALHWSYIGRVERGQVNLTLTSILRLAEVLQVDAAALVGGLRPD